ncbi:MAG TPA: hypothetical protein VGO57_05350 [Verrucomicrobiae bacterium]|jgi:hypothetical protein
MKSTLFDLARKWGVGVCLLLWCWFTHALMCLAAVLLLLLSYFGVPILVIKILIGAYVIVCVPLIAYRFGREFAAYHGKTLTSKTKDSCQTNPPMA